jgi:hypothetical protein
VQRVFELSDLLRQRWLRYVQRLGRAREMAVSRNRQKVPDMPQ